MSANAKVLLAFVVCALLAHAQNSSPTSSAPIALPSGLDDCILGCVSQAAAGTGCGTFTNLTCVCTSTAFQQTAAQCLSASCNQTDQQTAQQLQNVECSALSTGSVSTAPSTASSSASSSHSSTGSSSSPAATNSSAAMGLSAPLSFGSIVGTLVTSAGVLVGALFVL